MSRNPLSAPRTILVVDDDPAVRNLALKCLKSQGFDVQEAADGVQACESAEANPPDLVLLDLLLPRLDGYGVLLRLRSHESTRPIPVLLVSGEPEAEQADIGRTLGAEGFLPKPFTCSGLVSAVESALVRKAQP